MCCRHVLLNELPSGKVSRRPNELCRAKHCRSLRPADLPTLVGIDGAPADQQYIGPHYFVHGIRSLEPRWSS